MKRCPQCRRDYLDDSLLYCLEDGSSLIQGSVPSPDEPGTVLMAGTPSAADDEGSTRPFIATAELAEGKKTGKQSPQGTGLLASRLTKRTFAVAIALLLVLAAAGYLYSRRENSGHISSIAVMPFSNDSGNADIEYLSDGMAETLMQNLSQMPGLNVKSRSTVFRYKGKDIDVKTIGRELGVQAILNGRVVQLGDSLRLALELINTNNENIIWTETYDRKLTDLVSLQNDIARDVSNKLKLKLSHNDEQKLAKNYTADPEVYRLYLQGRYYRNKRSFAEVAKAVPYFKEAVERDPNFALGWVGLADSDEDTDRPLKREYIRKALDIDPDLAEAHASLGYQYMLDYDWRASESELKRAIELDPKYGQAYAWNGARLMMIGKYDEALAAIEQALVIDPASNGFNFYKGVCLGAAGRLDESIEQFKRSIALDPLFPWPHSHGSRIYRLKGDLATAAEERAISLDLDGRPELARGIRESFARGGWNGVQAYMRTINTGLSVLLTPRPKDEWINELTDQAQQGSFWLFLIKTDPIFDPLRGDPRFEAIVNKFDPPAN